MLSYDSIEGVVSYLQPFVICEEAECHQGVAHEEPVDKLLYYIDERVERAVGQLRQQGTVPHQHHRLSHTHMFHNGYSHTI